MKIILSLIILTLSLTAYAQNKTEKSEKEEGAASRLIEKKRAKMRGHTTGSLPEKQQERNPGPQVNDDFDPQKGGIDDELSRDEGMEND